MNQNQKQLKSKSFHKHEEDEKSSSNPSKKGDAQNSSISMDSKLSSQQTTGQINSYQEFSKIFNPKSVGLQSKGVRRSSHENNSSSHMEEKQQNISGFGNNGNRGGSQLPPDREIDYRAKVMMEKEKRKKDEEEKRLRELDQIRQENVQKRQEAIQKEQSQYRPSTALIFALGDNKNKNQMAADQSPTLPNNSGLGS